MIGAVDARLPGQVEYYGDERNPALVAETDSYTIRRVQWPVLEGAGLLLRPKHSASAFVVAMGDADQPLEQRGFRVATMPEPCHSLNSMNGPLSIKD